MADVNGNGSIQILVTPLGGASPSGQSAVIIRAQLIKALSGRGGVPVNVMPKINVATFVKEIQTQLNSVGVKINVAPVITGATGAGAGTSVATGNVVVLDEETRAAHRAAAALHEKAAATQNTTATVDAATAATRNTTAAIEEEIATLQRETATSERNVAQSRERVQAGREAIAMRKMEEAETNRTIAAQERERRTLASMRMELAKFNQYLLTLNPKALTQYAGQINNIRTLLGSGVAADGQKAATAMKSFKAEMVAAGYEGGNAFAMLATKMKTYFSYFISSSVIMALYSGVSNLISNVKDLDEAMTDLRIVTGNTRKETDDLLKSYNALAQKLGTTTVEVSQGATDWLRQGFTGDEAEELLTQSMTLSIVGDMESADATDALTAALKGYKLEVEDASSVVDKFMTVDMAAATSSEDLALALAKTAANAKIAGLSLDDVIGQLAVVNEVMKEDGSSTGTFYNTMLSRMGAIKSGRLVDPEDESESLSDVETTLNRLGVALRDTNGDFRNFGEVLDEVGSKWESYSDINKRAIAQSFAGKMCA